MPKKRVCILSCLLGLTVLIYGCSSSVKRGAEAFSSEGDRTLSPAADQSTILFTPSLTVEPSLTSTQSPTETPSPTITHTATASATFTATPVPTYVVLRAKVLEQANCRYGPGVAYLYKYGLYPESNIEVIGRNERGTFAYIQAIGGDNPCWVSASVLDIKGDIMNTAPTTSVLPFSQYYGPPQSVNARREGDMVIISWSPVQMTEDKYRGYLIEAWVCQQGELVFTPLRSDETILNLTDEQGCDTPSSGRLYTAEKHGYSQWKVIPWPPNDGEEGLNGETPAPTALPE